MNLILLLTFMSTLCYAEVRMSRCDDFANDLDAITKTMEPPHRIQSLSSTPLRLMYLTASEEEHTNQKCQELSLDFSTTPSTYSISFVDSNNEPGGLSGELKLLTDSEGTSTYLVLYDVPTVRSVFSSDNGTHSVAFIIGISATELMLFSCRVEDAEYYGSYYYFSSEAIHYSDMSCVDEVFGSEYNIPAGEMEAVNWAECEAARPQQ